MQTARADDDLQRVAQNIRGVLLQSSDSRLKITQTAEDLLRSMKSDGSWADQNYADRNRIHWKAVEHLPRLEVILKAYYQPDHPLSGNRAVLNRGITSLRFWLDKDPSNENWWENEIFVPNHIGEILLLLGNDAPEDLKHRGMEIMKRANWQRQTGANLTDETKVQVMRGCIADSPELISQAYDRTWQEVHLAELGGEGMQADHSFHQHGELLYNQGYGAVYVSDIIQFVAYAKGTRYQIPGDKQQIFDAYLLGGTYWMARGKTWDFSPCGRGITRPGSLNNNNLIAIGKMSEIPGPDQPDLLAATKLLTASDDKSAPIGNRQFWLSDYMVHRRANYFASMRMYSTRTLNTDGFINGENRKSHHMADGATCLMVNGGEYFNIFPVWDWLRIPGTTVEQNTPLDPKNVQHKGKNAFVGGVSDGTYGCSAMELAWADLHADKAWFCFDDEIVCLGAGIACRTANPVLTSINQCLLNGEVITSNGYGRVTAGNRDLRNPRWVWHDSIGYIFPTPITVHLKNEAQTGAWSEIGTGSDKQISQNVFSLWIDHGSGVQDGQYEYILMPGADRSRTAAESQNLPLKILRNNPAMQAVWHDRLHILEAVFHQPGEVTAGGIHLSVDKPCILLLKPDQTKLELAISNPENAAETVKVVIDLPLSGDDSVRNGNNSIIKVALPTGITAGSSAVREFTVAPN
jgi:chondroitin AC lyase